MDEDPEEDWGGKLYVGVMSAVIVAPTSIFFAVLFKKSGPHQDRFEGMGLRALQEIEPTNYLVGY